MAYAIFGGSRHSRNRLFGYVVWLEGVPAARPTTSFRKNYRRANQARGNIPEFENLLTHIALGLLSLDDTTVAGD